MAKSKNLICVDSCTLISYLDGGKHRTEEEKAELIGFFNTASEDNSPLHLIFPTFERAEILQCEMPDGAIDTLNSILDRPNIEEVPINQQIATIAAEIRNHHTNARKTDLSLFELTSPDAFVLATAAYYECGAVYTYDGVR